MMKLSEFELTHTKGESPSDWEYFAEVTVTSGVLWWKKTERRKIHRECAGFWHFIDTGEFTPGHQAENLYRGCAAREILRSLEQQ